MPVRGGAPRAGATWRDVARRLDVSRETQQALDSFVDHLSHWSRAFNLVGPGTLDQIWDRHIADSAQLVAHAPEARTWIDLGSGAGFPGIVIAILLRRHSEARVTLVEAIGRKAAFLRHVGNALDLPVDVRAERIEAVLDAESQPWEVVTARALAPLDRLIALATPALAKGATGLFLKGANVEAELTAIPECWKKRITLLPSWTDSAARIVRVSPVDRDD